MISRRKKTGLKESRIRGTKDDTWLDHESVRVMDNSKAGATMDNHSGPILLLENFLRLPTSNVVINFITN